MENKMLNIVDLAKEYVSDLFTKKLPEQITYHNLNHTLEVLENSIEIGENLSISNSDLEIVKLAALFHDTGWIKNGENHENYSAEIAREFLNTHNYNSDKIEKVIDLILFTKRTREPENIIQSIIYDADILHAGKKGFHSKSQSLKSEIEFRNGEIIDEIKWIEENIKFLDKFEFKTDYAIKKYGDRKIKNLAKLQKKHKQLMYAHTDETSISKNNAKISDEYNLKDDQKIGRGVETMFRNTIRTHVEFSSMADSKANIMISVNTLILTAIVAFLAKSLDANPYLIPPAAILTTVSLITLIIAITVTRPQITSGKFTEDEIKAKKTNLLFFGNFYNMDLKYFEWGMNEMIKDSKYLYNNMIKDYYYLGQVLGGKYKKLRFCYNFFMYGIVISVIAFAISIFLAPIV